MVGSMKEKLTEEELVQLGRRAVAAKGWKFRVGMKLRDLPNGIQASWLVPHGLNLRVASCSGECFVFYSEHSIPDLNDPGTLGHLHDLVELAWSLPDGIELHHHSDEGVWRATWSSATHGGECGVGVTKAEALVDALERA